MLCARSLLVRGKVLTIPTLAPFGVMDSRHFTEGSHDALNLGNAHKASVRSVPGRKTDHAARSFFCLRDQEISVANFPGGRIGPQGGVIVVEKKCPCELEIFRSPARAFSGQ